VVLKLPDDGNGGLVQYIERDKTYADIPHEAESEATLAELSEEAKDEVKDAVIEVASFGDLSHKIYPLDVVCYECRKCT